MWSGPIGLPVFATLANDYEAVMGSVNAGQPIALNGNNTYGRDVRVLGARLAGLTPPKPERRGLRALFGGRRDKES